LLEYLPVNIKEENMSESFAELFENSVEQQNVKVGALLMGTVV